MFINTTSFVVSLGSALPPKLLRKHRVSNRRYGAWQQCTRRCKCDRSYCSKHTNIRKVTTACDTHPTAAYIHLPFCAQRCAYCAFTVLVSGRESLPKQSGGDIKNALPAHISYVDLLCREIKSFFALYGREHGNAHFPALTTVYLGGGTPSLLHPTLLERVLDTLIQHARVAPDVELTCEMDPATFNDTSARAFADLGVNRASIGAQSFDDGVLAACGRVHRSADIYTAVETVRAVGIDNVSLDLISALPNMTHAVWDHSLCETLALSPSHVSIYDLTVEPKTRFFTQKQRGDLHLPSEDSAVAMLKHAAGKLKLNGYERYEVSNFAKKDPSLTTKSQHNLAYWHGESFYAFGIGATSLVDETRFARPTRLSQYQNFVNSIERAASSDKIINEDDVARILYPDATKRSKLESFEDFVINTMRMLSQGIVLAQVGEKFGREYMQRLRNALTGPCEHLVAEGLIKASVDTEGMVTQVCLTEEGAMIENTVVSDLLLETVWRNPPE